MSFVRKFKLNHKETALVTSWVDPFYGFDLFIIQFCLKYKSFDELRKIKLNLKDILRSLKHKVQICCSLEIHSVTWILLLKDISNFDCNIIIGRFKERKQCKWSFVFAIYNSYYLKALGLFPFDIFWNLYEYNLIKTNFHVDIQSTTSNFSTFEFLKHKELYDVP